MPEREFDLFGEPILAPRGPGRPRHCPTVQLRDQVQAMRAAGASQIKIAAAIGITVPTLLRNYHQELGSHSKLWLQRTNQHDEGANCHGSSMEDAGA